MTEQQSGIAPNVVAKMHTDGSLTITVVGRTDLGPIYLDFQAVDKVYDLIDRWRKCRAAEEPICVRLLTSTPQNGPEMS